MADALAEFEWSVPEQGYEWREVPRGTSVEWMGPGLSGMGPSLSSSRGPESFLVERQGTGEEQSRRRYHPLRDETGLFQAFANLELSKAGVASFANRYGWAWQAGGRELQCSRRRQGPGGAFTSHTTTTDEG